MKINQFWIQRMKYLLTKKIILITEYSNEWGGVNELWDLDSQNPEQVF